MSGLPEVPPALSTPDAHIFADAAPVTRPTTAHKRSDEEIVITYEIQRTVAEIRRGRWRRIALQFPDAMLSDAPRVFEALGRGLKRASQVEKSGPRERGSEAVTKGMGELEMSPDAKPEERLYILADTSYGACCVDEIAAEHVDAEVVVHYGRACLSPTARLPVMHVFTIQPLALEPLFRSFEETYSDSKGKVILMADVIFSSHLQEIAEALQQRGYENLFTTSIIHDPSSPLPNRTIPEEVQESSSKLAEWDLFHISDPPQSLLLTLSSRLASIHIYPTSQQKSSEKPQSLLVSTGLALRRRYALLTSLNTAPIFGILINTLSVKNYLHIVEHVKAQILAAGKKSYTFVVGKVNAAKIANFSEIGGWVVIGCWESSLVENKDFWKPVITPFELEIALKGDGQRIWTGQWRSDFQRILDDRKTSNFVAMGRDAVITDDNGIEDIVDGSDLDSEPESAPPEFDLRTGKYVSHSRPMRTHEIPTDKSPKMTESGGRTQTNGSMIRRHQGDLAVVGGEASPGAEFLQSKRTWKGLGSDFEIAYDESVGEASTVVEEGRSGIARGYQVGDESVRR